MKNVDLWQRLDAALGRTEVRWHWVKGHAGHAENERADPLAPRRRSAVQARLRDKLQAILRIIRCSRPSMSSPSATSWSAS